MWALWKCMTLTPQPARSRGRSLPMLDAVRGRVSEAVEAGMRDKDWSGMADYTLNQRN